MLPVAHPEHQVGERQVRDHLPVPDEQVQPLDVRGRQLWIPVGFGHGFCVLSEEADVVYKCTAYYDPAAESGISFADPDVGIEWPRAVELLYSERDRNAPSLAEVAESLPLSYAA